MESQPQNPEFRNNSENFHPCCVKAMHLLGNISVGERQKNPNSKLLDINKTKLCSGPAWRVHIAV